MSGQPDVTLMMMVVLFCVDMAVGRRLSDAAFQRGIDFAKKAFILPFPYLILCDVFANGASRQVTGHTSAGPIWSPPVFVWFLPLWGFTLAVYILMLASPALYFKWEARIFAAIAALGLLTLVACLLGQPAVRLWLAHRL